MLNIKRYKTIRVALLALTVFMAGCGGSEDRAAAYLDKAQQYYDQENYEKAIELNPDYYEANYNLGVMHYNKARDVVSELNNLPLNEYRKSEAAYEEKAHVHFNEALPYFEKAAEVKPNEDIQLLETLEGVYLQLHMEDKAKALEERIKALSGQ